MIDTSQSREDRWRSRERMVETMIVPPKGGAIIVRVDGRAFHTLTRRMEKPFDARMTNAMDSAASAMAKAMPSVVATYTQSDEISAIIAIPEQDRPIRQEEIIPFAGRVQKLASVMASAAAAGFARSMPDAPGIAVFDGRVIKARSPEEVRDYARAALLYNEVEQYHAPLRPALQALLGEVKDDYLRSLVIEQSNHYRDLALLKDADVASLMPNEPLAGLTDGKEILDKIIEPYRGRIVYVDFWGTWCVPCKNYLKNNTHPLHQALSDLPVTYLFLCNGSETEAWRSTIAEYKLTGEPFVHYNLPADQQQAVEQYLGIHKFPTYIIFDQDGQRVTTEADEPRPYNPEAVRETMLKLNDK